MISRRPRTCLRRLLIASPIVLGVIALLPSAPAGAAVGGRNAIPARDLAGMSLVDRGSFARSASDIAWVETSGAQLVRARLDAVLDEGVDTTRPACHETDVRAAVPYDAACWSEVDDGTNEWFPQGLTGSGDAANRSSYFIPCRGCAQRQVVAVSWHRRNRMARVTFVDVTAGLSNARYTHVLLVQPERSERRFRAFRSHADGLAWYGNRLFLFSGGLRPVRVFDLRNIWRMSDTTSATVGCSDATATCAAAGATFVMPQVGFYSYAGGRSCRSRVGSRPCFSSLSVDRSTAPDSLVTAEYSSAHHGRILRWPLSAAKTRLLASRGGRVHPTAGWFAQVRRVQGASFHGHRAIISGLCQPGSPPTSYLDGSDSFGGNMAKSCLYRGRLRLGGKLLSLRQWTTLPANSQNVSYWPANGRLWTVNEFRGSSAHTGDRLLLSLRCPGLRCS